ncbi:MAG TPA: LuxR C-terminal-related transcriptional regulator [Albitalea sp.]|nr:LuxR C-terminal-related transcriptional regulator [Albitalea sp.]
MTAQRSTEHASADSGDAAAAMSFNRTKLLPPAALRDGVPREHLLRSLDEQTHARVVLLLAPAGYGKTTLMRQWMERLAAAGAHTSWLTLDETDNDPVRLIHYLAGALREWMQQAQRAVGEDGATLPAHADWMSLLDRIDPAAPPLTLFLDEIEKLTDPAALLVARMLVSRLPRSIRLVIGSREKPALGLERHRVRGQLIELTVGSLRFSADETRRFLGGRFARPLAGWLIDKVQSMTDGWPAAVQLTALATRSQQDLERYAVDPSDGLHHIADYLAEDVLQAQPQEVREFLLDTCGLPRLGAAVCDAATGRRDSARLLQYLERHGLFTSPLDANHSWFRYHPLFAEFLQGQQAQLLPRERVVAIHRGAGRWFSRHGTAMEAVDLLLAAGDTAAAIKEMATCAPELVIQAQFGTIARWIERLDAAALAAAGPELPLAAAWACGFAGDLAAARRWLDELRPRLAASAEHRALFDQLVALEAVLMAFGGQTQAALRAGLTHWERVGAGHDFAAGALANVISYCLVEQGDFAQARHFSSIARSCNEEVGSALGLGYALTIAGSLEAVEGRLDRAVEMFAAVDRMVSLRLQQPWFETTHVRLASIGLIASILYEQDRLDEADELLQRYHPLLVHQPSVDLQLLNQLVLARLRMAQGDAQGALRTLDEGLHAVGGSGFDLVRRLLDWERVRIDLIAGRSAQALAFAEVLASRARADADPGRLIFVEELYGGGMEEVRCLVAAGRAAEALSRLESQIACARSAGRLWRLLKLQLLRVLALDAAGDRTRAQAELADSLELGARLGARRSFADEGPRLDALLAELPATLLAARPDGEALVRYWRDLRGEFSAPAAIDAGDGTPLSERERSILRLLATGLGNEPIAAQLFLSVNTVKWHIRRILDKLKARNRSEAVFIARQSKLL